MRAGLQENKRREIAEALDKVASDTETRAHILDSIAAKNASHVEKVATILKLCTSGMLTEGQLLGKARAIIMTHLLPSPASSTTTPPTWQAALPRASPKRPRGS